MTRTSGNHESCSDCDSTWTGSRLSLILLTRVLMLMPFVFWAYPLAPQTNSIASLQKQVSQQHFVCNVGYTPQQCRVASEVLKKALAQYPVEALGNWKWVLVRTEDWKQILSVRGFDTERPAFSYLPKRETFLDGSLLFGVSSRGVELRMKWHMPVEDLLDLAIRHELGHALCNESDESKADRAATALKNGTPLKCRASEQASTATPK